MIFELVRKTSTIAHRFPMTIALSSSFFLITSNESTSFDGDDPIFDNKSVFDRGSTPFLTPFQSIS